MTTYKCTAPEGLFTACHHAKPDAAPDPFIFMLQACHAFGVTVKQIKSRSRRREIVLTRQVIMFRLFYTYGWQLKRIGKEFNRNHTTVIYARETVRNLIETRHECTETLHRLMPELLERWQPLKNKIKSAA